MSRARAVFFVLLVWAAIYFPRLGSLEIKSEEGRRILPALTMIESGNYIVPQVGSEPYFRKPPLVNWLVAGSFELFGVRNEWTARLPSVLCVLAVALAFIGVARRTLGPMGSFVAALIWLTNFGLLEKGRLIEIEALYVSLTALALICWLSWWDEPGRRWVAWTAPWIFLGFGLLAKGPLNLVFLYAIVVTILWQRRGLRQLWSGPHLLGVLLMIGIFAAWAVPCLEMTNNAHVATVWSRQFSGRLSGEDFKFHEWLLNIPRSLGYLLPWILLLPFARFARLDSEAARKFARALALGIAVPFVVVNLMPGALPRYTMPLLAPAIWLIAMFVRTPAISWSKNVLRAVYWTVGVTAAAMLVYSIAIIPVLQRRAKVRPIGEHITAAIPPNESLYAIDPDYQPFLFYVRRPIVYVSQIDELPANARYLLVQPDREKSAEQSERWSPQHARPILREKDYRGKRIILLQVSR